MHPTGHESLKACVPPTPPPQCPHGNVRGIMRSSAEGVFTCSPSESLEDIIPRLDKVTGMPVIGADGKVIGVISRKVRGTW